MSRRILSLTLCSLFVLGAITGCGGSSDDGGISAAAYAGMYDAAYTRGGGTLTLAVATNGQITITIVDDSAGTFTGTGIANHVGGFYITCNGTAGRQVTVNGTLKGTGVGRTASGTVAGSFAVPFNATFTGSPDATLYTNHYEGYYSDGASSNNWLGDVDAAGNFSGQLLVTTGSAVNLTGNVYSNGSMKITGSGNGKNYVITGNFHIAPAKIQCDGILKGTQTPNTEGEFHGHSAIGG